MKISHYVENNIYVISIEGALIQNIYDDAEEYVHMFIKNEDLEGVILDCEKITMLDSFGVVFIVSNFQILQKMNKRLVLCNPTKDIHDLLKVLKLDQVVDIFSSLEESIESFATN